MDANARLALAKTKFASGATGATRTHVEHGALHGVDRRVELVRRELTLAPVAAATLTLDFRRNVERSRTMDIRETGSGPALVLLIATMRSSQPMPSRSRSSRPARGVSARGSRSRSS